MTDLSRRNVLIGAGAVVTVAAIPATVIPFPLQEVPALAPVTFFSGAVSRAGCLLWRAMFDDAIVDWNGDRIISFSVAPAEDDGGPEVRKVTITRDPETLRLAFSPSITEVTFVRAGKTYVRYGDVEYAVDANDANDATKHGDG